MNFTRKSRLADLLSRANHMTTESSHCIVTDGRRPSEKDTSQTTSKESHHNLSKFIPHLTASLAFILIPRFL